MSEYVFVFDGGWWLKIDSIEKLADYHKKIGAGKFEEAFLLYLREGRPENMPLEERIKRANDRDFKYLQAAIMQAEKIEGSILDGFRCLNLEIGMNQMRNIREHGAVYINRVGGHTFSVEYTQFCRREEPVFPDFKEEDIRILKYPYGCHWYAYIGDMQVRSRDGMKWNTYDAAKQAAMRILR